MLALRKVGALGIKVLGVTYLAQTVLAGFSLLSTRFMPSEGGPPDAFLVAQVVGALGYPIVAWLLIGTADDLAERLFPDVAVPGSFKARDLLTVGLAIVGLAMAASAIPALIQGLGLAVYYGEATRQQLADARFEREWPELVREGLTLVTGLAVAAASRPIASRFSVDSE